MNLRQPVRITRDGLPVSGVIVGRCYHDNQMHYDIREGASRIHADVPEEKVEANHGDD